MLARDEAHRREQEARAQATHATRVGAMGAIAASLAHELTQPLAASLANAETGVRLLAAAEPDLDELRATLADIVAEERRTGELVQKLRRFLRRGEVERGDLDLRGVLEEVLHLIGREAEARGVRLHLEVADVMPKIVGDRVQLQQVVLNLLSNAIDAVAAGDRPAREVTVLAGRSGDGVRVEIRDSGAGMDAETLARIFQAFFTTKPKGMGLGLSISRTIVDAHGGTLSAHSAPGMGSTFRSSFHCGHPAHRLTAPAAAAGTVFVIDDDASVRRALERKLRTAGFRVETFESAQDYVAHAPQANRLHPDQRPDARHEPGSTSRLARAGRPRAADGVHHRLRRHPDHRPRDEGRRGRLPAEAVLRARDPRRGGGSARAERARSSGSAARSGASARATSR